MAERVGNFPELKLNDGVNGFGKSEHLAYDEHPGE